MRGEWWGEGWQEAPGGRGKRGRVRKVCGEGCGEEHNHLYNPAGVRHWRVSLPPVMVFDAATSCSHLIREFDQRIFWGVGRTKP